MAHIVPERPYKGNIQPQTLVFIAIVVLVGLAAFGLGRLSAAQAPQAGISIHEPGEAASINQ